MNMDQAEVRAFFYSKVVELKSFEAASKLVQVKVGDSWCSRDNLVIDCNLHSCETLRIKPETHIVNGHEVPAPYREAPDHNSYYYWVRHHKVNHACWEGHDCDIEALKLNNCFKSESDAEENRLAMFKLGKYAEVKS